MAEYEELGPGTGAAPDAPPPPAAPEKPLGLDDVRPLGADDNVNLKSESQIKKLNVKSPKDKSKQKDDDGGSQEKSEKKKDKKKKKEKKDKKKDKKNDKKKKKDEYLTEKDKKKLRDTGSAMVGFGLSIFLLAFIFLVVVLLHIYKVASFIKLLV